MSNKNMQNITKNEFTSDEKKKDVQDKDDRDIEQRYLDEEEPEFYDEDEEEEPEFYDEDEEEEPEFYDEDEEEFYDEDDEEIEYIDEDEEDSEFYDEGDEEDWEEDEEDWEDSESDDYGRTLSDYDDDDEYDDDEYGDEKTGMKPAGKRKLLIVLGSIVGAIALVYIGVSIFFMSHFYYNTTINGVDFSMKTVKDVQTYMKKEVQDYSLTIIEKDNVTDAISGADIDLRYEENSDIEKALKKQNAFLWPKGFFSKNSARVTVEVAYDQAVLDKKIQSLKCISQVEQTDPVSAYPKFDGQKFVVEPEVLGTKVNQEVLSEKIHDYIAGFKHELNMEKEECYVLPKYTSQSKEVAAACETMNKYTAASITYTIGANTEVVDKALISTWLTYDDNMNVTFNNDAVTAYMDEFGNKYDTVGKTRTITTPGGKTTEVSGGTYGWSVDEAAEAQALMASIQNGEVVTKEPAYEQTAASHDGADWGSTYAEVDLSAQYMWYIVNGAVALETPIVTGEPIPAKQTPAGVYNVLEKELGKTLVGEIVPETGKPEYETPVAFWMRITWTGIGFHDATWQPSFGGSMFQDGYGSHGCINMPYDKASALYDLMPMETPVIVHY